MVSSSSAGQDAVERWCGPRGIRRAMLRARPYSLGLIYPPFTITVTVIVVLIQWQ